MTASSLNSLEQLPCRAPDTVHLTRTTQWFTYNKSTVHGDADVKDSVYAALARRLTLAATSRLYYPAGMPRRQWQHGIRGWAPHVFALGVLPTLIILQATLCNFAQAQYGPFSTVYAASANWTQVAGNANMRCDADITGPPYGHMVSHSHRQKKRSWAQAAKRLQLGQCAWVQLG